MDVKIRGAPDQSTVTALINHQYGSEEVFFRSRDVALEATPDALVPLALIPAMYLGEPLTVHGPLSPELHGNIGRLQTLLNAFDPVLGQVDVQTEPASHNQRSEKRRVACFFSGGVDSFYSLIRHRPELDALVFIRGFDAPVESDDVFEVVLPPLRRAAQEFGIRLIEVETNLKNFSNRFVDWPYHYYGAALASVGHLLGGSFRRFYMAGGYSYALIPANGAHPLLDPLWGSDDVEFVYDGGEATRSQKVSLIASSPAALRSVRVCTENSGEYNCGRCKKCLLTMAALRAAGLLDRCPAFARSLDLVALSQLDISHPLYSFRLREVIDGVDLAGGDRDLEVALLTPLLRAARNNYLERAGEYTPLPLKLFSPKHGRVSHSGDVARIDTPARAWAYAASLPLHKALAKQKLDPMPGAMAFLRIRLRVKGGATGVGVTTRDGRAFLDRLEVRPSGDSRNIYLRLADPAEAGDLVIQTWNRPEQGSAFVESIAVYFADGEGLAGMGMPTTGGA